jgi:uncharacterized repeat protein (TIGR02543 family)
MPRPRPRALRLLTAAAFALVIAACGGPTPPVETQTLSVSVEGNGRVTSVPVGINTTGNASFDFATGTEVTLTAVADDGWSFDSWSGDCTGAGACVVDLDADASVTATFTEDADLDPTYDLTVTVGGTGEGSVTSDVGGIDLAVGENDTVTFDASTVVTLTATADAGSVFAGWSGACTGTGTCEVTMTADRSVTATFAPEGAPVTVDFNILAGTDDAEEYVEYVNDDYPAGSVHLDSSELDLAYDIGRGPIVIGLRFGNVTIPAGSTITSASISFTRNGSPGSAVINFTVEGHDTDNAATFVGGPSGPLNDVTSRTRTTASAAWNIAANVAPPVTSDLSAIVQEIVDRGGWAEGNALAFLISSSNSTETVHVRTSSFEGGNPPVLTITYVPPAVP